MKDPGITNAAYFRLTGLRRVKKYVVIGGIDVFSLK